MIARTLDFETPPRSVCDLVDRWTQKQPNHTAIVCGSREVTYGELNDAVSRILRLLLSRSVQPGDAVPVLARRNPEMVACFLAVMKLGACYVPIDTETWSEDRILWTLQRVAAPVVLDADGSCHYQSQSYQVISYDEIAATFLSPAISLTENGAGDIVRQIEPTDLAYIIFTSGTTSTPKGVMIPHRGLLNYVMQGDEETPFNGNPTADDALLLIFSPGFDACTGVLFSGLCNGAQVIIATASDFLHCVKKCTILPATPSILGTIEDPGICSGVRTVIIGGEPPSASLVRKWSRVGRDIYNGYGPTETTCASLMAKLQADEPITLGNPMSNSRVILLDGVSEANYGEICISGPGLAVGYYQNSELTAEKFIIWQGDRFYRTGDFAKRGKYGLEFVGRKDSFVKNRGFLINLESQVIPLLYSSPGVLAATAFLHQGRLVGFIAPSHLDAGVIRYNLSLQYDSFLVPDFIRVVDSIPLTPNGKIDNRALKLLLESDTAGMQVTSVGSSKLDILKAGVASAICVPISEISHEQSFWALGGNSLAALKVISFLRQRDFDLQLRALFVSDSLATACDFMEEIKDRTDGDKTAHGDYKRTVGQPDKMRGSPMTTLQTKMVRRVLQNPGLGYMLLRISFPHPGTVIDEPQFRTSWLKIMQRHAIFQTSFCLGDGSQRIRPTLSFDWSSQQSTADKAARVIEDTDVLLRQSILHSPNEDALEFHPHNVFRLVTVPQEVSTLLVLVHHSQADGWSFAVMLDELRAVLDGRSLAAAPDFTYVALEQKRLQEKLENRIFWDDLFKAHPDPPTLRLPCPNASAPRTDWTQGCRINLGIKPAELDDVARKMHVTQTVLLYMAWGFVLSYYTGSDQISFGAVFSGRNIGVTGADCTVGPMLNTCPFFIDFSPEETVTSLASQVFTTLLQALEVQWSADKAMADMPADYIKRVLQTIVVMEYDLPTLSGSCETLPGQWTIERKDLMEFDISLLLEKEAGYLHAHILYDASLYTGGSISRLLDHFKNSLHALLDPTVWSLHDVWARILDREETSRLLGKQMMSHPGPKTVKDAFEAAVARWPRLRAVESPQLCLTYDQLNEAANKVAHQLRSFSKPEDVVVVLADGSPYWVIAILAVFKAGCICCAVDIKLPRSRVDAILLHSKATTLLASQRSCLGAVGNSSSLNILVCSELLQSSSHQADPLTTVSRPKSTVYIVFTSGSTGVPKGVPLHNISILNVIENAFVRLHSYPGRRNAQLLSLGFDVVLVELFGSLCYGATLVLKNPNDPFAHLKHVDATFATPSLLAAFVPTDYPNLDTIALAGEPVPQALCNAWGHKCLMNLYGPAECGMISTGIRLIPGHEVTIGRPLPRLNAYLLNTQRYPVPVGVIGELFLSGEQITTGYWSSPEETKARFIENPFEKEQVMYRTGDLAYWNDAGNLVYVRRVDNQIKVRGYRVELEEIERALRAADPSIRSAAAVVADGVRIIAFVAPETIDIIALRRRLVCSLPSYTRPTEIIPLPSLPTSANLKIDRQALHGLASTHEGRGNLPSTPTELMIANIWKDKLSLPSSRQIYKNDDFLGIGGNSLLSISAARAISAALQHNIPVSLLIRETVLEDLARLVDRYVMEKSSQDGDDGSFVSYLTTRAGVEDLKVPLVPSPLEEEIFWSYSRSGTKSAFHTATDLIATGHINHEVLLQSFTSLIRENPILRARYVLKGGTVLRKISDQVSPPRLFLGEELSLEDLDALANEPFQMESDQLIRVIVWKKSFDQTVVALIIHHIITDKASIALMLQTASQTYQSFMGDGLIPENIKPISADANYIDWTQWCQEKAATETGNDKKKEHFWKEYLRGVQRSPLYHSTTRLPLDNKGGCTHQSTLLPYLPGATFSQRLAVAATALCLEAVFEISDLTLGIPFMNRDEEPTGSLLGLFLDRLPVRLRLYAKDIVDSSGGLLTYVASEISQVVNHQLPYSQIRRCGEIDQLFDVMIVYHWRSDSLESSFHLSPGVRIQAGDLRPRGAMYPLMFEFTELPEGLKCDVEYNPSLISGVDIGAIVSSLRPAIEGLTTHSELEMIRSALTAAKRMKA